MTKRSSRFLYVIAAWLVLPGLAMSAERSARDILNAVDDMHRGESAQGRMQMTVHATNWVRKLEIAFWSKGEERSLMRILAPAKEKGTSTLKVEKNLWNYLPRVRRVIKVPSTMMGGSWMGSHFTNDDLVGGSRMADDYTYEITFEGQRSGRAVVEITCIPHPDAAVVWGKVVVQVDASYLPTMIQYFDEDMALSRTMVFSDVKEMDGRRVPARMTVTPADKPEESTAIEYLEMQYDTGISDDFFTLGNLKR